MINIEDSTRYNHFAKSLAHSFAAFDSRQIIDSSANYRVLYDEDQVIDPIAEQEYKKYVRYNQPDWQPTPSTQKRAVLPGTATLYDFSKHCQYLLDVGADHDVETDTYTLKDSDGKEVYDPKGSMQGAFKQALEKKAIEQISVCEFERRRKQEGKQDCHFLGISYNHGAAFVSVDPQKQYVIKEFKFDEFDEELIGLHAWRCQQKLPNTANVLNSNASDTTGNGAIQRGFAFALYEYKGTMGLEEYLVKYSHSAQHVHDAMTQVGAIIANLDKRQIGLLDSKVDAFRVDEKTGKVYLVDVDSLMPINEEKYAAYTVDDIVLHKGSSICYLPQEMDLKKHPENITKHYQYNDIKNFRLGVMFVKSAILTSLSDDKVKQNIQSMEALFDKLAAYETRGDDYSEDFEQNKGDLAALMTGHYLTETQKEIIRQGKFDPEKLIRETIPGADQTRKTIKRIKSVEKSIQQAKAHIKKINQEIKDLTIQNKSHPTDENCKLLENKREALEAAQQKLTEHKQMIKELNKLLGNIRQAVVDRNRLNKQINDLKPQVDEARKQIKNNHGMATHKQDLIIDQYQDLIKERNRLDDIISGARDENLYKLRKWVNAWENIVKIANKETAITDEDRKNFKQNRLVINEYEEKLVECGVFPENTNVSSKKFVTENLAKYSPIVKDIDAAKALRKEIKWLKKSVIDHPQGIQNYRDKELLVRKGMIENGEADKAFNGLNKSNPVVNWLSVKLMQDLNKDRTFTTEEINNIHKISHEIGEIFMVKDSAGKALHYDYASSAKFFAILDQFIDKDKLSTGKEIEQALIKAAFLYQYFTTGQVSQIIRDNLSKKYKSSSAKDSDKKIVKRIIKNNRDFSRHLVTKAFADCAQNSKNFSNANNANQKSPILNWLGRKYVQCLPDNSVLSSQEISLIQKLANETAQYFVGQLASEHQFCEFLDGAIDVKKLQTPQDVIDQYIKAAFLYQYLRTGHVSQVIRDNLPKKFCGQFFKGTNDRIARRIIRADPIFAGDFRTKAYTDSIPDIQRIKEEQPNNNEIRERIDCYTKIIRERLKGGNRSQSMDDSAGQHKHKRTVKNSRARANTDLTGRYSSACVIKGESNINKKMQKTPRIPSLANCSYISDGMGGNLTEKTAQKKQHKYYSSENNKPNPASFYATCSQEASKDYDYPSLNYLIFI